MEYQGPPIPVQQFCIRQTGDSAVPGRYFIAFNANPAEAFRSGGIRLPLSDCA